MRKSLLVLLLLAASLTSACASKQPATDLPVAVAVLVDISGSATGLHQRYDSDFQRVLAALKGNERLVTFTIEANSSVSPMAFDMTFETSHGNDYTRQVALKRQAKDASERFTGMLQTQRPSRPGSAIIDGIRHASDLLTKLPAEQEKVVVILSDMIEQSEVADFSGLTPADGAALVARLKQEGKLPALAGARVYVAGITDASGALPSSRVQAIRAFWESFFEAAGARLEWYGPSLTEFRVTNTTPQS